MKDLAELSSWSPKQLRTLRNNLNNRLSSFELKSEKIVELQKSHVLFGKGERECKELLQQVLQVIKLHRKD